MSDEDKDEEEKDNWADERGLVDMETRRLTNPELRMLELIEKLSERVGVNDEESRRRDEEWQRRAEQTQRNIEFIIQQQAQFSTETQRKIDSIVNQQEQFGTETQRKIDSIVNQQAQFSTETQRKIDSIVNQQAQFGTETQRKIDFIVSQQAQFNADLQQLREVQARAEQKWERTANGINALLAIAEIHQQEIEELRRTQADAQAEAQARQARTDAQMAETDRRMAETGERLNALINTVERIISERRNGGQQGS